MNLLKHTHFHHAKKPAIAIAAILAFLTLEINLSQAQTMEYVVFSIEGEIEGLSLGQVLHEGDQFEVPENASINLIGKDGQIITLSGPAAATVTNEKDDKEGEQALSSISKRLFEDSAFIQVAGGTRSTDKETSVRNFLAGQQLDDAWIPTLSNADTYCVRANAVILRREKAVDELELHLADNKIVKWETGSYMLNLGEDVATDTTGDAIKLSVGDRPVKLFLSEEPLGQTAEQAAWLAEKGCTLQALKLLAGKVGN